MTYQFLRNVYDLPSILHKSTSQSPHMSTLPSNVLLTAHQKTPLLLTSTHLVCCFSLYLNGNTQGLSSFVLQPYR